MLTQHVTSGAVPKENKIHLKHVFAGSSGSSDAAST